MEDYIQEFEVLVSLTPNIANDQLMGYFLVGWHTTIRNQIRPHDLKDLMRIMEFALDLEENTQTEKGETNTYRISFS